MSGEDILLAMGVNGVLSVIGAAIAHTKGRSFVAWWAGGIFIGWLFSMIGAIFISRQETKKLDRRVIVMIAVGIMAVGIVASFIKF